MTKGHNVLRRSIGTFQTHRCPTVVHRCTVNQEHVEPWWYQPACASLQSVRPREIQDSVVTSIPILEATSQILFGGPWLKPHEGVAKMVVNVVVLGREIVTFRLPLLPNKGRILLRLVHVMRDRAHVVEELGIDWPTTIAIEYLGAN